MQPLDVIEEEEEEDIQQVHIDQLRGVRAPWPFAFSVCFSFCVSCVLSMLHFLFAFRYYRYLAMFESRARLIRGKRDLLCYGAMCSASASSHLVGHDSAVY
jgi:hypothetical protein